MRYSKFTLVELAVVIAIFALLLSILQPSLAKTYRHARELVCKNNLFMIQKAEEMVIQEGSDTIPPGVYIPHQFMTTPPSEARGRNMKHWQGVLANYIGSNYDICIWSPFDVPEQYLCPEDPYITPTGAGIKNSISYGLNGSIGWRYSRHGELSYVNEVPNLSELVLFADSDRNERLDFTILGTGHVWGYPGFVHELQTIAVFADMHPEYRYDFEITGLRKLNDD